MRVLCIGDPHFKVDNIPEVEKFIVETSRVVEEHKPDIIIVMGDLLHTHEKLHTEPLNKAVEFIDMLRQDTLVYVIVGNHDMKSNSTFLSDEHWMNFLKRWDNVHIVDRVCEYIFKDLKFILCPYVYPGRFIEALDTHPGWTDADCIFCHQEFYGCKMGAMESVVGDKWDSNYPRVISGHIHEKQHVSSNIYYTGASMQHNFGDSDNKTLALVTFVDKKGYTLNEIELELKKKKIVYAHPQDDIDKLMKKVSNTDDDIKVSMSGTKEEIKAFQKSKKYKKLVDMGVKVVLKQNKHDLEEVVEDINEGEFFAILESLVKKEGDESLIRLYEDIILNKPSIIFE